MDGKGLGAWDLWPGGSGMRDAGGKSASAPMPSGPSQGRKGMKEISSQILIDSFIYKNCKHNYHVN